MGLVALLAAPALAHQPYFEERDITAEAPWSVEDPAVSTALYATLESATDADYYTFDGQAGARVLVSLVIPQIEGQADFAPTMALIGPGLPDADLSDRVAAGDRDTGALVFAPAPGPAETFYEPFSRTSYWERQEEYVTLAVGGRYTVAVWHPEGRVGRYVFVVGDRELPGGDLTFPLKMRDYWTPVGTSGGPMGTWRMALVGIGTGLLLVAALVVLWGIRVTKHRRSRQNESAQAS
jgi:hypothetical protein